MKTGQTVLGYFPKEVVARKIGPLKSKMKPKEAEASALRKNNGRVSICEVPYGHSQRMIKKSQSGKGAKMIISIEKSKLFSDQWAHHLMIIGPR